MNTALNHWLEFDASESDDGVLTLEAMASVAPRDLPLAWAAVQEALARAHRTADCLPTPLELGGEWDMLLQVQSDDAPPLTLAWEATVQGADAPQADPSVRWVTLTLTVVTRESLGGLMQERLLND